MEPKQAIDFLFGGGAMWGPEAIKGMARIDYKPAHGTPECKCMGCGIIRQTKKDSK